MHRSNQLRRGWVLAGIVTAAALLPAVGLAQTTPVEGPWRYRASIYFYVPTLSGTTTAPTTGGGSVDIDADVMDKLKFTFMGALEAHNGRWGVVSDVLYLDLGDDKHGSRDFRIGGAGIPAGTSANLGWDLKGTIWTLAGEYRLRTEPALTLDALGGVRMARLRQASSWDISGSIGSLPPAARSGSSETRETLWDAIVGVRGRYAFGGGLRWSIPFFADIGTGNSKLTWQASAGLGYSYSWGELSVLWRYISYEMKSGGQLQDLKFNGPMFGATFAF